MRARHRLAIDQPRRDLHSGIFRGIAQYPVHQYLHCRDAVNYALAVCDMNDAEGNPLFARSGARAIPSVELYRRLLAEQPDSSVTVISVGFYTNLAQLLASQPDSVSPLSGRDPTPIPPTSTPRSMLHHPLRRFPPWHRHLEAALSHQPRKDRLSPQPQRLHLPRRIWPPLHPHRHHPLFHHRLPVARCRPRDRPPCRVDLHHPPRYHHPHPLSFPSRHVQ